MQKIPWDVPERVRGGMEVFLRMMRVRTALVFPACSTFPLGKTQGLYR